MFKKVIFSSVLLSLIVLIIVFFMFKPFFFSLFLHVILPDQTPHIGVDKLQMISKDSVVLLDTRSYEEFAVSHLEGASWVGFDDFSVDKIDTLPKDTTIVLYCSVGYRSDLVGKKLVEAGYQNVYNLWGGIFAWVNEGLPVYTDHILTQQIHPYSPSWGIWLTKGEKTYGNELKKTSQK